jgi:hypothetical protein
MPLITTRTGPYLRGYAARALEVGPEDAFFRFIIKS